MLIRSLGCAVVILSTGVSATLVEAPAAHAQVDANVVCAERHEATQTCLLELEVTLEGDPPTVTASVSGGGSGRQALCDRSDHYEAEQYQHYEHPTTPCQNEHGWYSPTYDCYFSLADKVLPEDDGVILPDAYQPGDPGAVYFGMCISAVHPDVELDDYCGHNCTPPDWTGAGHYRFLTSDPDGFGGTEDPVPGLLVEAIEELALEGPTIGTAPPAGSNTGLVRLPVWLWNEVSPNNWGTPSQSAGPIAGISVVAQAEATGIVWDMGDGNTIECEEGVAYEVGMPVYQPPCGHPYGRPSRDQPGGEYQISATTTWVLEWTTEGLPEERGGEFELDATSTTSLQINELQVLYGS